MVAIGLRKPYTKTVVAGLQIYDVYWTRSVDVIYRIEIPGIHLQDQKY